MGLQIDTKSGVPFYRQIVEQVKFGIAREDLQPGDQLPTVRQLAVDLSINPNTVIRAYRELEIEGVIDTHQGSGTYVGTRKPRIDAGGLVAADAAYHKAVIVGCQGRNQRPQVILDADGRCQRYLGAEDARGRSGDDPDGQFGRQPEHQTGLAPAAHNGS